MRPDADGLHICPSIPAAWDGFTMEKLFRGKQLSVTVKNPNHVQSGVASLTLNARHWTATMYRLLHWLTRTKSKLFWANFPKGNSIT